MRDGKDEELSEPRIDGWSLTSLQQRLVKTGGRLLPLAAFGRDPSDAATGWSNGVTDDGPHEAARTGLQDFWMGSSEPMMPIEGEIVLRWKQMRVHFPPARSKK
jgi:hypothetical protein